MISVRGVTKQFGDLTAVSNLDLEVGRGEVVGFLGPNGAGKTTTMRMLTGVLEPDQGGIYYDGSLISEDLNDAKQKIGYLPESNPLYTEMLVAEYLEYATSLRKMSSGEAKSGISDAVDETGISEVFFRPIYELSKGYRQRVGLAAAILHRPKILVLDEPAEGLDPNQRVDIRNLISNLGQERTVLLSSHVMQEVEATCKRILILNRGELIADGSVSDLLEKGKGRSEYTVEIAGDGIIDKLSVLEGVDSHSAEEVGGRTRVSLSVLGDEELRPVIFDLAQKEGWVLWELHKNQISLERLFRELTGDQEASE